MLATTAISHDHEARARSPAVGQAGEAVRGPTKQGCQRCKLSTVELKAVGRVVGRVTRLVTRVSRSFAVLTPRTHQPRSTATARRCRFVRRVGMLM